MKIHPACRRHSNRIMRIHNEQRANKVSGKVIKVSCTYLSMEYDRSGGREVQETYELKVVGSERRGIPIACAQSFVSFWRNWRTYKHSITKAQGWRGHLRTVKTCAMIASITLTSKRRSERTGSISNLQITGSQWFLFLRATTFVTLRKHAYVSTAKQCKFVW